jgi:hypothetical protein
MISQINDAVTELGYGRVEQSVDSMPDVQVL